MKSINIIGAGNVAYHLAIALYKSGHTINCIYNRSLDKAKEIATLVNANATNEIIELPDADLNIISIADDHILEIAEQLREAHGNKIKLIHTSGILDLDLFDDNIENIGCIWPLQSIIKEEEIDFQSIPLCIDANNEIFLTEIIAVGNSISNNVMHLPSQQKKHAHVAAVFANNFSNHMFHLADNYCKEYNLNFEILMPLITQSVQKLKYKKPNQIQTGPAQRMDMETIKLHLSLIKNKHTRKLYRDITKSIINTLHEDN